MPREILAPVNTAREVPSLMEAGAGRLYGGVVPVEWARRYPSTVALNQRTFGSAQFASLADLEEAVRVAAGYGGSLALALNAPYYMDEQMPLVMDLARWAAEKGVGALIVADPGLIRCLERAGTGLPLHLSTMGVAANALAVGLYARMGVARVILPRFLTVDQIAALTAQAPEVQYEAFILVGKCPHIEGLCTFLHDSSDRRWPCEWEWTLTQGPGGSFPASVAAHFGGLERSDRRDACGLCALPGLAAAGVRSFKIVGRGAPLERKVELVGRLRQLLDDLPEAPSEGWLVRCRRAYRDLYRHGCRAHNCYYPEAAGGW